MILNQSKIWSIMIYVASLLCERANCAQKFVPLATLKLDTSHVLTQYRNKITSAQRLGKEPTGLHIRR